MSQHGTGNIVDVDQHGLEESDSSLDTTKEAGIQNPFTTSLYANALAKAYLHRNTFLASLDHSDVVAKAKAAVKSMDSSCGITEPDAGAQVHPFIQYHALRAVLTLSLILENEADKEELGGLVEQAVSNAKRNIETLLST